MNQDNEKVTDLTARIAAAKEKHEEKPVEPSPKGDAFRVAADLIGGVAAGSILGYFFDKWLGTSPLFFIVFFFFGVAGGFYNIYRHSQK